MLVDALTGLADRQWTLDCVGALDRDPAFVAALRRRADRDGLAGRVRWHGPLTGPALDAAYAGADLLVLPSRAETYGMVVVEALARGLPVLGTTAGGVSEALGRTADGTPPGTLVPPGDPAALAGGAAPLAALGRPARAAAPGGPGPAGRPARLAGHHDRDLPGAGRSEDMTAYATDPFADWLRLREPADADARSGELVDLLRARLTGTGTAAGAGGSGMPTTAAGGPGTATGGAAGRSPAGEGGPGMLVAGAGSVTPLRGDRPWVVHDLGSGTGSMLRWLAPLLPGPQRWVLHDRDPGLLDRAGAAVPVAADGSPVEVTTRQGDLTRLTAADLADADLVTASALLDMFSAEEITGWWPPAPASAARACSCSPWSVGWCSTRPTRWTPRSPPPSTPTSGVPSTAGTCSGRTPRRRPSRSSAGTGCR